MSKILAPINAEIEQVIAEKILGEDVGYETSLTLVPGPDGNPAGAVIVAVQVRAVTIGQRHTGVGMVPLGFPVEAYREAASQILDALLQRRQQEMNTPPVSPDGPLLRP